MGGYNFNVNPVEIADPMEMAVKRAQLKGYGIQNQQQQVQLQNQQQDLQDQQAFRQAMTDPSMQGKTIGQVADTLAQSGHISMKGYQAAKQADVEFQKNLSGLTSSQLENLQKGHAMTQELYNNVMNMPDDQLQSQWGAIAQHYDSIPGNKPLLDPSQPMSKQQLQQFAPLIDMNQAYLSSEAAKRQAAAKEAEMTANAAKATAETALTNQKIQSGAGVPVEQQSLTAWLKKNPGKDASDFEVAMKKIVPAYNFNLQNQGAGGGGQSSALAQAVASGQMKWGDVISPRTPQSVKANFAKEVMAINPNFNSGDFQVEQGVKKAFTSGKPAEELVAFNTAIAHADLLQKAADALNNGDIKAANKLGNAIGVQFGSDKATNFGVIKNAYTREVTKALSAGHLTDAEISQQGGTIPADASPAQIKGALSAYRSLMASKVQQRQAQYQSGMQAKPNFGGPTLTNQNQGAADPFAQFGGVPHK